MSRLSDDSIDFGPNHISSWRKWLPSFVTIILAATVSFHSVGPVLAHDQRDDVGRTAIVSAFAPEIEVLRRETTDAKAHMVNGVEFVTGTLEEQPILLFLSGISVVNSAMTVQLALDRFAVDRIVFSGIAGGLDPNLNIGDVVVAERWGQYLETVIARESADGFTLPGFFEYPYEGFGTLIPRSLTVVREGSEAPETRFWFPVDHDLLEIARSATTEVALRKCTDAAICLHNAPRIIVGGTGISGSAFVDNAAFRDYAFSTFEARLVDMESAAVAHVAWANHVPFVAVRSLSDLAGGSEQENELPVFLELAAANSAEVVRALLREMPN